MAGGQFYNHLVAARYRVVGSGSFYSKANSLDETYTKNLPTITLAATNANYPNLNTNFKQANIQLELWVDAIGASFTLKQIILYMKPVASGIPG